MQNVSVEENIPWRDYVPLMPLRYAEAPRGQREEPYEAFETHGETSTHSSFLYPCVFLKCRQIRAHQLFMPLTRPAA